MLTCCCMPAADMFHTPAADVFIRHYDDATLAFFAAWPALPMLMPPFRFDIFA